MSSIIAARFQTFDRAEGAVLALTDANVERADVAIANDSANAEPDAIESANDVVTGAALGGSIGLAVGITVPVVGAAVTATAVGVGAYTGSFAGGLSDASEEGVGTPASRRAGVLVAVSLKGDQATQRASIILRAEGGEDLEMADGVLHDGEWIDFDPVTPRRFISEPVDVQ